MPGVVRTNLDSHVGHASGTPNPFHQTSYVQGSPNVFSNNENTVRIGDQTACGDAAAVGSPNVFINNIAVHRQRDATTGHGSWVPNAALTGSEDVLANQNPQPFVLSISNEKLQIINEQQTKYEEDPEEFENDVDITNNQVPRFDPLTVDVSGERQPPSNPSNPPSYPKSYNPVSPPRSEIVPPNTQASAADIVPFLQQILQESNNGKWDELGAIPGNANIINLWAELGFDMTNDFWLNDDTPWCAGFMNWVLKRTGYRWIQSARAFDIADRTDDYSATPVPIDQGQPGDIAVWSYSHVNFIYTANSGTYTFVGGNQSDRGRNDNNPSGGSVTRSWPNGYTVPGNNTLRAIYRPSKT